MAFCNQHSQHPEMQNHKTYHPKMQKSVEGIFWGIFFGFFGDFFLVFFFDLG